MNALLASAAYAARAARYYLTAGSDHGLHAPFVYDLYTLAVRHPGPFGAWGPIEARRAALLADPRRVAVLDLGAGSRAASATATTERRVADIARRAAKPPRYGQLLFRLVNYLQPRHTLELGTSLGLSTAYLAAADSRNHVLTLEGDPASAGVARDTFQRLGLRNVSLREGAFADTLPGALAQLNGRLDFAFFDGHHAYDPTLAYVRTCLPARHAATVFVLDDIHWSQEMEAAWAAVKAMPEVSLTIDLFAFGLVFFRPNAPKQHFVLRY